LRHLPEGVERAEAAVGEEDFAVFQVFGVSPRYLTFFLLPSALFGVSPRYLTFFLLPSAFYSVFGVSPRYLTFFLLPSAFYSVPCYSGFLRSVY
jgi:hypothetical protein